MISGHLGVVIAVELVAAYEKISEEYSDILIAGKVNIDEEPQIAEAEKIEMIAYAGFISRWKGNRFYCCT